MTTRDKIFVAAVAAATLCIVPTLSPAAFRELARWYFPVGGLAFFAMLILAGRS
jgi:hypothetical protein